MSTLTSVEQNALFGRKGVVVLSAPASERLEKKPTPFPADLLGVVSALGSWYLLGQIHVHPGYQFLIEDFCLHDPPDLCRLSGSQFGYSTCCVLWPQFRLSTELPEVQRLGLARVYTPTFPSQCLTSCRGTPAPPRTEPLCPPHICWGCCQWHWALVHSSG